MAAKYKICPHCSHKIKPTTTFCIHCGKDLRNVKFVEYNNALVAESSVSKTENVVPEVEKAPSTPVEQPTPVSSQPVPTEVPSVIPQFTNTVPNNNVSEVIAETKPFAEPTVNTEVVPNNTVERINPIKEPVYTGTVELKQEEKVVNEEPVVQVQQSLPEKTQVAEPDVQRPQVEPQRTEPATPISPVQQTVQNNASDRPNPFKNIRNNVFSNENAVQNTPAPTVEKIVQDEVKQQTVVVFEESAKPAPAPMEYSTPPVAPVEPVIVPTPEPVAPVIAPAPVVQTEVATEEPITATTQSFAAPTHEVSSNTPVQKPKPTMEMQSFVLEIPPQPVVENRPVQVQETIEQAQTIVENNNSSNLVQNNVFEPQMQNSPIYEQKALNEAPTPSTQPQNNVQEFDEFMVTDNIPTTNTETTQNDNFVPNMQDIEHTKRGVVLGRIPEEEEETEEEKDIFFKNEDTIREEPYDARKDGYYNDVEAEIEEEIKHTMADSTKKTIIAVVLSLIAIVIFALWKGYI